jgi:mannose-6-phosphate isomerase
MTKLYPLTFEPIYKEKIWGGRALERLFGRDLPAGKKIGESWELADLAEGVSVVAAGPVAGTTLTDLTERWGEGLLGKARPMPGGRFPLLLKFLDANDILSLQVHPDAEAVAEIGPPAALKTECWYVVESRDGSICKGVAAGVGPAEFRKAIEAGSAEAVEKVVRRIPVKAGDFHYMPAGTVHALGAGTVVAEVQTPSDTTYRVTDWGRGREIHVERSMQCIRFDLGDSQPGAAGERLLATDYFSVYLRRVPPGASADLAARGCTALMTVAGRGVVNAGGGGGEDVPLRAGQTVLVPAALGHCRVEADEALTYLEISLPGEATT